MYEISNDYKAAIHGRVTQASLTFTIGETEYSETNILRGSFSISNQCTGTADVTLGAVYVGVLNATLVNVNLTRETWRGQKITPVFHFLVDEANDTWEDLPLGVYTISSAEWKSAGVTIRAYDNMSLLDVPFSISQGTGQLYDFLTLAAQACDIELGQTRAEFEELPNATPVYQFYSNTDVETWRDLVSYIAQVVAGFATVDRSGNLVIRTYGQNAVDSISPVERHNGAVFSDYKTKYTSYSLQFIESKETKIYAATINDGMMLNLGANPFLQSEFQANTISATMLAAIANIQYVPYKISLASNPVYDLGDVLEFTSGLAGTTSICCVQKYEWTLHKALKLSGFGSDPNSIEAKSKTQKEIATVASAVNNAAMGSYEVRNVSGYTILNGNHRRVLNIKFISTVASRIQIHMNVNLQTLADDGYDFTKVKATFTVNNNDDDTLYPQETYVDGKHVMHLMYILPIAADSIVYFNLTLDAEDGSITIGQGAIWAYADGAGLVGDGRWSGTFDLFDDVEDVVIPDLEIITPTETIEISAQVPVGATITENALQITMAEMDVDAATDSVRIIDNYHEAYVRIIENEEDVRVAENGDIRMTEERF